MFRGGPCGVGEHADAFELGVAEEMGFVENEDGGAAAFDAFDCEGVTLDRGIEARA